MCVDHSLSEVHAPVYKALSHLLSPRWEDGKAGITAITLDYELLEGTHLVCFVR